MFHIERFSGNTKQRIHTIQAPCMVFIYHFLEGCLFIEICSFIKINWFIFYYFWEFNFRKSKWQSIEQLQNKQFMQLCQIRWYLLSCVEKKRKQCNRYKQMHKNILSTLKCWYFKLEPLLHIMRIDSQKDKTKLNKQWTLEASLF